MMRPGPSPRLPFPGGARFAFTVMDDTYWTGYPSAERAPYTDPVPNWANTKYMMVKLKPKQ